MNLEAFGGIPPYIINGQPRTVRYAFDSPNTLSKLCYKFSIKLIGEYAKVSLDAPHEVLLMGHDLIHFAALCTKTGVGSTFNPPDTEYSISEFIAHARAWMERECPSYYFTGPDTVLYYDVSNVNSAAGLSTALGIDRLHPEIDDVLAEDSWHRVVALQSGIVVHEIERGRAEVQTGEFIFQSGQQFPIDRNFCVEICRDM